MRSLVALALFALFAFVALCVASTSTALAQGDGVYQRWDRDSTLSLAIGGGVTLGEENTAATATAEVRFRVVDAAGPVLAGRWGPDAGGYVFLGLELRPLFPALFLIDKPIGNEFFDLLIQSIGVELGVAYFPGDPRGFALGFGVGLEIPLVLPSRWSNTGSPEGVWLRLAARRIDATPGFSGTPDSEDRSEWTLMATLGIKLGVNLGVSRWEPPRYRRR